MGGGPNDYPMKALFQRYVPPPTPGGRGTWIPAGYRWIRLVPKKGEFQAPTGQNKAYFRAFTPMPRNNDPIDKKISIDMRFQAGGKQYEISYVAPDTENADEILIDCSSSRSAEVI